MARRQRRPRRAAAGGHNNTERWLLTYADMITLLLALFIVLFAMGNIDPTKNQLFARSVQDALNGKILTGGEAIMHTSGQVDSTKLMQSAPTPSLQRALSAAAQSGKSAAQEERDLQRLKERVESEAAQKNLTGKVQTQLTREGLQVRLLSDDFLFDSGSADLKAGSAAIIGRISQLLRFDATHRVRVSGHTDSVPVSGQYPSNWELSTARASAVVRAFARGRVAPARMEAAGRAHLDPIGSNGTAIGRSKNRRVEILIPRHRAAPATGSTTTN